MNGAKIMSITASQTKSHQQRALLRHALVFSVAVVLAGCTHTAAIKDITAVYGMPLIRGAPKIVLADLSDNRVDKSLGQVGALSFSEGETPINVILSNRIASRLRDEGFNVQKTNLSDPENTQELRDVLESSNASAFLAGGLNLFFISSFDAIMETAKGNVDFSVDVFDQKRGVLFQGKYSARAKHLIGLTGQFGGEKLIEKSVQASVDELFQDKRFNDVLLSLKKQEPK